MYTKNIGKRVPGEGELSNSRHCLLVADFVTSITTRRLPRDPMPEKLNIEYHLKVDVIDNSNQGNRNERNPSKHLTTV